MAARLTAIPLSERMERQVEDGAGYVYSRWRVRAGLCPVVVALWWCTAKNEEKAERRGK